MDTATPYESLYESVQRWRICHGEPAKLKIRSTIVSQLIQELGVATHTNITFATFMGIPVEVMFDHDAPDWAIIAGEIEGDKG